MKNKTPSIRYATTDDFIAFYGECPPYTMRAIVILLDEKPIGMGGVVVSKDSVAIFSDIHDTLKSYKKTFVRGMHEVMRMAHEFNLPIYAVETEPTSPTVLKHLGFENNGQGVYTWVS